MKCIESITKLSFQPYFVLFFLIPQCLSSSHCSREGSRLVRKVLNKNFYPIFDYYGVNTTEGCPLRRSRDLYLIEEEHKLFVHNAKWSCQACGKAFYTQVFLDLHMENKHQDLQVTEALSPVCLADFCELFRCDALNKDRRNKHFWSKALCQAANMAKLRKKCLSLVKSCIPNDETLESFKDVYNDIVEETCALVNCKDYWKPLEYELSLYELLYYLTFTPVYIFAMGLYYCKVWEHYYGDESEHEETDEREQRRSSENEFQTLRKRYVANTRFQY